MIDKDVIQRGLVFDNSAVVSIAKTTSLVNEAIKIHSLSPVASAALGRVLTACAMLSYDIDREQDTLTVSINGGGEIGNIVVSSDSKANVRGYVDFPKVFSTLNEFGKLDVAKAVGVDGDLCVIKSNGDASPYVSRTKLVSGEIAEDFAYYFATSEQKPSVIALGVLVHANDEESTKECYSAGGVFIHIMPFCSDEIIEKIEKQIIPKLSGISGLFAEKTPKEIFGELFSDDEIKYTEEIFPSLKCKCSENSIEKVLVSLGKKEAEDIIAEQGKISIKCHFCEKEYIYTQKDVDRIFA